MIKAKKKKKKFRNHLILAIKNRNKVDKAKFILGIPVAILIDLLHYLKIMLITLLIIGTVAGIVVGCIAYSKFKPYYDEYNAFAEECVNNSTEETFKTEESTYIYDSNDKLLIKLRGEQDSAYLNYDNIPPLVIDAFVAVEDRSFWSNPGIDFKGLVRVARDYIKSDGDEMHGASTITQQLARNIFLSHEVSLQRKAKEMLIALKLTEKYTKRQIMEYYVNDICFANSFYGVEAASKGYFNKNSNELTLSQIAYVCAIPNSPEYYNPYKYPERALERRDKILGDMYELDLISREQYNEAINEVINIEKPEYTFNDYQSTFAIDCATKYIMGLDGFEFRYSFEDMNDYNAYKTEYSVAYDSAKHNIVTGGYKIYTSLDSSVQNDMQDILNSELEFDVDKNEETGAYELQGAVTVVDNNTRKVIAIIGGRTQSGDDIQSSEVYSLNRAYQSNRQSGSSIKPLVVYTPALMKGYTPDTIVYNINVSEAKKKGTDVQSLVGASMTLRSALEQSKNGVAWQTFDRFGADYCMSFLNQMKFASICPDDYYNSSSLGGLTNGVTTVEMAGAYSTLVNHGQYTEATCIEKMIDSNGNDVYKQEEAVQVYDKKSADTMVDMMTGVIKRGTASKLQWYSESDIVAACKTGTTNQSKDGWLCGFTPYYTIVVWVGFDQPKELSNLYGATYPGQIWKKCMLSLTKDCMPKEEFDKTPEYYEESKVKEPLPSSAYKYLEGRDDDEILAKDYTVYDFRKDRVSGERVLSLINSMNTVDLYSLTWVNDVTNYYNTCASIISTIKSTEYKNELQLQLDANHLNDIAIHNNLFKVPIQ